MNEEGRKEARSKCQMLCERVYGVCVGGVIRCVERMIINPPFEDATERGKEAVSSAAVPLLL